MIYFLLYTCGALGLLCASLLFLFLRQRSRRRSLPGSLLHLAGSLAVAFLVAELCVRLAMTAFLADDSQPTSFDAELGWSRPPGNRVAPAPGTNSAGEDSAIVFVGDSVAFGHGVAPEDGMVHQTRRLLESHGKPVLNAAVSGYGIDQTSLYVKRHLASWEELEILVLALFAGNDLADTASNMRYGHDKPLFRHTGGSLHQSSGELSRYSRRNLLTESRLIYSFEALYPPVSRFVDDLSGRVVLDEDETRRVARALLADLLHETKARDVLVLQVLIPAKADFAAPSPSYLWLEEAMQKSGGPSLSLLALLKSQGLDADTAFLPGDPWHLSAEGHRIAARLIADTILALPPPG